MGDLMVDRVFIFIYLNFNWFCCYWCVREYMDLDFVLMFYFMCYSLMSCFDLVCGYVFWFKCFEIEGIESDGRFIFCVIFDLVFECFVVFCMFWLMYCLCFCLWV